MRPLKRSARIAIAMAALALMPAPVSAAEPRPITWEALRDAAQGRQPAAAALDKLAAGQRQGAGLLGQEIAIEGYLLPVDKEGDNVYEFMLVPFAGACSHMPQPPSNQIVHVFARPAYPAREVYEPVRVSGTLRAERETTQFFMIDGVKVVETDFTIGQAAVEPATSIKPAIKPRNPLLHKAK